MDGRHAIADEIVAHLLNVSFSVPRQFSDEQAAEHGKDLRREVAALLPKRWSADAMRDFGHSLRARLKRESKAMTWPTVREVLEAGEAELRLMSPAKPGSQDKLPEGDAHPGVGWFVSQTLDWVQRFDNWPHWLGRYEQRVLADLRRHGEFTEARLKRLGAPVARRGSACGAEVSEG